MSVIVTIQGTPVSFPTAGEPADWAPPVVQFAQLVEQALSGFVGQADIPPQVMVIDAFNPGTNVTIPNLSFSTSIVRGAVMDYTVFRTTSTSTAYEIGEIWIIYNPSGPVGNKWEISKQRTGDGLISFAITDTGQFQFSTTAMSGINHAGRLTFSAKAILQIGS